MRKKEKQRQIQDVKGYWKVYARSSKKKELRTNEKEIFNNNQKLEDKQKIMQNQALTI